MANRRVLTVLYLLLFTRSAQPLLLCTENGTQTVRLCTKNAFYDRSVPAEPFPRNVTTFVMLNSVAELDATLNTIKIDLTINTHWNDTRLSVNEKSKDWYNPTREEIKDLFFPTLEFNRAKDIYNEAKYAPLRLDYFWFHKATEEFEYQQTLKVTTYCNFDFSLFPFDYHNCKLDFGASDKSVAYILLRSPNILHNGQEIALGMPAIQMDQASLPFDIFIQSQPAFLVEKSGFNFSFTGIELYLRRNSLGLLNGSFYAPTLIFTCLSLISFSIHPDIVPGRLGLLITLYLIASNVYNSVQGPPSRGFSYIEIWMIGVHIPMLTAIFEYGFLMVVKRQHLNITNDIERFCSLIDKITFLLSSAFIVIFNVTYWGITGSL